uniref:beta strand repeat-containing protein n=1 Tax=Scytonema sp. HK-05 TaxID=1137095 RepID=UPI000965F3AF
NITFNNNGGAGTQATASGSAGDITVIAKNSFETSNQSGLGSKTFGTGNGGVINVEANSFVVSNQSGLGSSTFGVGNSGVINVKANSFVVSNNSGLTSTTSGAGNGGVINVEANSVRLEEGSGFGATSFSKGGVGEINIKVGDLVIRNSGIGNESSSGSNGGKINIDANSFRLESAGIISTTGKDSTGNGGEININVAGSFAVNNSNIDLRSFGTGNAGTISITAKNMQIEGGILQSNTDNLSKPGNIYIRATDSFKVTKAGITANSSGTGDAGTISIIAKNVQMEGGGIESSASNSGKSGNISINATDSFVLINLPNAPNARITANSSSIGNAGTISITAKNVQIEHAVVDSVIQSTGKAGEINFNVADSFDLKSTSINTNTSGVVDGGKIYISAKKLQMEDASITSDASNIGRGGDIELQIGNLLLLRGQNFRSFISTTAVSGSGNGGNISINAPNGFIVTVPNENSDITANAFSGGGGKITIKSLSNFGIQQRSREDLKRLLGTTEPNQLKPENSPTNDITAFSLTSPTLEGQVTINTPDFDPSKGFVELPTLLADISEVIDTSCAAFASREGNKFTVTGRGGLPPSPYEPLSTDVVWTDTRTRAITTHQQGKKEPANLPQSKPEAIKIVPATGWVFNGKGQVTLISHASNPNGIGTPPASCPKR